MKKKEAFRLDIHWIIDLSMVSACGHGHVNLVVFRLLFYRVKNIYCFRIGVVIRHCLQLVEAAKHRRDGADYHSLKLLRAFGCSCIHLDTLEVDGVLVYCDDRELSRLHDDPTTLMLMGSMLQDSHRSVGNSLDCVLYYCNVGNEVSCPGGGLDVVDRTRDLGGCELHWDSFLGDDLGSSLVWHPVAFCSLLLDLVSDNPYANLEEVAQGCTVVPNGRVGVPANCYDSYDLLP